MYNIEKKSKEELKHDRDILLMQIEELKKELRKKEEAVKNIEIMLGKKWY